VSYVIIGSFRDTKGVLQQEMKEEEMTQNVAAGKLFKTRQQWTRFKFKFKEEDQTQNWNLVRTSYLSTYTKARAQMEKSRRSLED